MSLEDKALSIPEDLAALDPEKVTELARIWWGENTPYMNIRPALNEPRFVGTMLAECAWHFSQAYAQMRGLDQAEAFKSICDAWDEAHARAAASRKETSQ
jgi:hypothetical protein